MRFEQNDQHLVNIFKCTLNESYRFLKSDFKEGFSQGSTWQWANIGNGSALGRWQVTTCTNDDLTQWPSLNYSTVSRIQYLHLMFCMPYIYVSNSASFLSCTHRLSFSKDAVLTFSIQIKSMHRFIFFNTHGLYNQYWIRRSLTQASHIDMKSMS